MFEHRILKKILFLSLLVYVGYFTSSLLTSKELHFENRNQIKDELNKFIYHDRTFRADVADVPQSDYDVVIYNRVAKCGK